MVSGTTCGQMSVSAGRPNNHFYQSFAILIRELPKRGCVKDDWDNEGR